MAICGGIIPPRHPAYVRGQQDADRGRPPIFRQVGSTIEPAIDDPQADEWDQEQRQEYLKGYDSW